MDAEEREIFYFLKQRRHEFVSAREICRRAGGKLKFRASADWAKPLLGRMVERGILEVDNSSHYRIKPLPKSSVMKRWVAPHIAAALRDRNKEFGEIVITDSDMDEYYERL